MGDIKHSNCCKGSILEDVSRWIGRRAVVGSALLLAMVLVAVQWGAYLHESDQASLLAGGYQISRTGVLDASSYNLNVQYLSYAVVGGLIALVPGDTQDVLCATNALNLVFFWGGMAVLVLSSSKRKMGWLLAVAVLAPSLIVHSPYLASNYLSSGALFGLVLCMRQSRGTAARWLIPLLVFLSVGLRADAVLVLPLVCWLYFPRVDRMRKQHWQRLACMIVSACIALYVGYLLAEGRTVTRYEPFFYPKLFAAYSLFGLGGAGVGLVVFYIALGMYLGIALKRRLWMKGLDLLAGAGVILLPFLYYGVQLFSTRHWTAGIVAIIFLAVHRKSNGIWSLIARLFPRAKFWAVGFALVAAILPVAVGLKFTGPVRFHPSMLHPTVFPSADGMVPTGGYAAFAFGKCDRSPGVRDHTQALWNACLELSRSDVVLSSEDALPVLYAGTLREVLRCAVIAGQIPYRLVNWNEISAMHPVVGDERLFTRYAKQLNVNPDGDPEDVTGYYGISRLTSESGMNGLVLIQPGSNEMAQIYRCLRKLNKGNEFYPPELQIAQQGFWKETGAVEVGYRFSLVSKVSFQVKQGDEISGAAMNGEGFWYCTRIASRAGMVEVKMNGTGKIYRTVAVLPYFMSQERL